MYRKFKTTFCSAPSNIAGRGICQFRFLFDDNLAVGLGRAALGSALGLLIGGV